jgi:hypothetical protein
LCFLARRGAPWGGVFCLTAQKKVRAPKKLLHGEGNQTRFLRVPSAEVLDRPEVHALFGAAVAQATIPFPPSGRGLLTIRLISAKQRPRRKDA